MPDFPLPNYQQPQGTRMTNITNHNGPALYVQGGETINASTFGWGSFDSVDIMGASYNNSSSGNFTALVIYPVGQGSNNVSGSNTVKIKWLQSNGTEVANNSNLSLEFLRMEYQGG